MEANELMIGDYLMRNGFPYRVIQVDGIVRDGWMIENGEEDCGEPIPITPELLEKNGFVLKPDGWLWCKEKGIEDMNYIFIQFRKGCDEVRLCELNFVNKMFAKYERMHNVHELQHALRICKIDKTFEL